MSTRNNIVLFGLLAAAPCIVAVAHMASDDAPPVFANKSLSEAKAADEFVRTLLAYRNLD